MINLQGRMNQHVVKCGSCNEATVGYLFYFLKMNSQLPNIVQQKSAEIARIVSEIYLRFRQHFVRGVMLKLC